MVDKSPLKGVVRLATELTKEDALNLLRIMNRVKFEGLQEAAVAMQIHHKLNAIIEAENGKDVPSSDQ